MSSIEAISDRFFFLQLRFTELINKCTTEAQEEKVNSEFTSASACHDAAINRVFNENASNVASLRTSLAANTSSLRQQMENDTQIVTILSTITAGGELASELLALGQA